MTCAGQPLADLGLAIDHQDTTQEPRAQAVSSAAPRATSRRFEGGRRRMNWAPLSVVLEACRLPPGLWTMPRLTARPTPVPTPNALVVKIGSKMREWMVGLRSPIETYISSRCHSGCGLG